MKTKIGVITLLFSIGSTAIANDILVNRDIESFIGVGTATGITATVECGTTNKVEFNIDEENADRVKTDISNGILKISFDRNGWGSWFSNSSPPKIQITTNGKLSSLKTSTGANLDVDGCAVDTNQVEIKLSTGSVMNVGGETNNLDIKLSTGSVFNEDDDSILAAKNIQIKGSTGSVAKLCNSEKVSGKLSTGAVITVSDGTDTDVSLSTGAAVSRNCEN